MYAKRRRTVLPRGLSHNITVYAWIQFCSSFLCVSDQFTISRTKWNSTNISKRSDPKVYTSENVPIRVLFTDNDTKRPYNKGGEENISEHQLRGCGISYEIIINLHQEKKYLVRFLKSTYLISIFIIYKPEYLCIKCLCYLYLYYILNVQRLRTIQDE